MKEWRCIQVGHHDEVASNYGVGTAGMATKLINTAGMGGSGTINYTINHYLLFEREQ